MTKRCAGCSCVESEFNAFCVRDGETVCASCAFYVDERAALLANKCAHCGKPIEPVDGWEVCGEACANAYAPADP